MSWYQMLSTVRANDLHRLSRHRTTALDVVTIGRRQSHGASSTVLVDMNRLC